MMSERTGHRVAEAVALTLVVGSRRLTWMVRDPSHRWWVMRTPHAKCQVVVVQAGPRRSPPSRTRGHSPAAASPRRV